MQAKAEKAKQSDKQQKAHCMAMTLAASVLVIQLAWTGGHHAACMGLSHLVQVQKSRAGTVLTHSALVTEQTLLGWWSSLTIALCTHMLCMAEHECKVMLWMKGSLQQVVLALSPQSLNDVHHGKCGCNHGGGDNNDDCYSFGPKIIERMCVSLGRRGSPIEKLTAPAKRLQRRLWPSHVSAKTNWERVGGQVSDREREREREIEREREREREREKKKDSHMNRWNGNMGVR